MPMGTQKDRPLAFLMKMIIRIFTPKVSGDLFPLPSIFLVSDSSFCKIKERLQDLKENGLPRPVCELASQ